MPKPITVNMISESEFTVKGHGVHTAYLEIARAIQKQPGIKLLVNSKKPADIIHIHSTGPYGLAKLLKRKGKKVVSAHIVPNSLVDAVVGGRGLKLLAKPYLKSFYKKADLVLAPSAAVAKELERDMKISGVKVFFNYIDTTNYHRTAKDRKKARAELGIKDKQFVVIGNGQVQPLKRFDLFIDLASQNPEIRFFWVGGIPFKAIGAELAKMKRLIKSVPDNLTVTGVVELEDVKKYYHAGDLFVSTSKQETFGVAILEAAASGLPIVIRNIPDFDDTFKPDAALANNDQEFDEQIKKFANMSSAEYQKWVRKSAKIANRFDSQTAAQQLVKYYRELLK